MKKLITLLTAAMMVFALASCDNDPADVSSSGSSADTSSVASFEKPEKVTHDGSNPGSYGGITMDVSTEITADQSTFDNYSCGAQWIDENTFAVFYIHNIQTMPNYFEPRLIVSIYKAENGEFSADLQPVTKDFSSGYAIGAKTFDGGFVAVFKETVEVYDASFNKTASYSATEVTAYDVSDSGKVVYVDAGELKMDGAAVNSGISGVKSCGISPDGSVIAAGNDTAGVVLKADGSKVADADLASLDKRYEVIITDEAVYFAGRPRAGVKLTAEKVTFDGAKSTLSYGELFENTYAQGSIFEDKGSIYLVSALTQSSNDFGHAEIAKLDADLKATDDVTKLEGGYHNYHRYDLSESGKLLFTENLAQDGVKDYLHIIE